jgi:hypothetical protein
MKQALSKDISIESNSSNLSKFNLKINLYGIYLIINLKFIFNLL